VVDGGYFTPSRKKRKKRPTSRGGHPSQGRPTVGGGTKSPPTRYKSPTPDPPKPGSQGHPSRGGTTVGGGTKKGGRPHAYKSPTPSIKKQRQKARREARKDQRELGRASP
jgi:hypothetical protein